MADLTIANLTAAGALTATDPVPVEQSGAAKRTTIKGILEADVQAVPKVDGLKFPATQVGSSNPNTLDDYEEGEWTVTLTPTTGTISLYEANGLGRYTKIGNIVHLSAWITVQTISSPTGTLTIGGFPYVIGSNNGDTCAASVAATGLAAGATTAIAAIIYKNTAAGIINKYAAGTLAGLAGDVQGGGANDFFFTATYKTT